MKTQTVSITEETLSDGSKVEYVWIEETGEYEDEYAVVGITPPTHQAALDLYAALVACGVSGGPRA